MRDANKSLLVSCVAAAAKPYHEHRECGQHYHKENRADYDHGQFPFVVQLLAIDFPIVIAFVQLCIPITFVDHLLTGGRGHQSVFGILYLRLQKVKIKVSLEADFGF